MKNFMFILVSIALHFVFFQQLTAQQSKQNKSIQTTSHIGVRSSLHILNVQLSNPVFLQIDQASALRNDETYESLTAFAGGVYMDIRFTNFFALQPECNIQQVGGSYVGSNTRLPAGTNTASYDFRAIQMELPLLAKISAGDIFWSVSALLGPGFGIIIGGNYDYEENANSGNSNLTFNQGGERLSTSLVAGLALEIDLGRGWLYGDARYSNTFSKAAVENVGDLSFSNTAFSIGYSMPLTK